MLVLDYSQVAYSIIGVEASRAPSGVDIEHNLVRHMILNVIRSYNHQYRFRYGQMIIACDAKSSWRHRAFPYYKASRKKNREESGINWEEIFKTITSLSHDLQAHFPMPVVRIEGAEADDIIGVLARKANADDPLMIISGDKDFKQLHNPFVSQFAPVQKKDIEIDHPGLYLGEQILRGDSGDGIPSMLCKDDHIVDEHSGRAPPVTKGIVAEFMDYWDPHAKDLDPEFFGAVEAGRVWGKTASKLSLTGELVRQRYERNKMLIDLRVTPPSIPRRVDEILQQNDRSDSISVMQFFADNDMKMLMDHVDDFMPAPKFL